MYILGVMTPRYNSTNFHGLVLDNFFHVNSNVDYVYKKSYFNRYIFIESRYSNNPLLFYCSEMKKSAAFGISKFLCVLFNFP